MLEHGIFRWEFDVLKLHELTGGHALAALGWRLFELHGVRSVLGMPQSKMQKFLQASGFSRYPPCGRFLCGARWKQHHCSIEPILQELERGYNDVPYHNSAHAACVCHSVHYLLTSNREVAGLTERPIEIFTAVSFHSHCNVLSSHHFLCLRAGAARVQHITM